LKDEFQCVAGFNFLPVLLLASNYWTSYCWNALHLRVYIPSV